MQSDQQKDMRNKLDKSIEGLVGEFRKIRTGRAHSSLLDHILSYVEYFQDQDYYFFQRHPCFYRNYEYVA